MMQGRGILVAGTGSGTGKTSLVCGILRALRNRGIAVRAAKCGPDYLDPLWLARASGTDCPNLDPWMSGHKGVRELAQGEGTLVIESAMGLYDGVCPSSDEGSAAEVARILGLPVLLILDASGSARTVAAIVRGMRDFGELPIVGVVANRVGSDKHAALLAQALESSGLPPLLGFLGKNAFPSLPERHLGLIPPAGSDGDTVLETMGQVVTNGIDLDRVLSLCAPLPIIPVPKQPNSCGHGLRLGLSWDDAFRFAYTPVVAGLEARGVEVVRFSPLTDPTLPPDLDGLWLCGGYPEVYAAQLDANRSMREDIAKFCQSKKPVLAECGGLLYLTTEIVDQVGNHHSMCGVIPAIGHMGNRLQALGYRTATAVEDLFVASQGTAIRGHEFHYGSLDGTWHANWRPAYKWSGSNGAMGLEGWWNGSVLATWFHGWLATDDALNQWIYAMQAGRVRRIA